MAMYHRENQQEDFLVLAGECVAVVEGEERTLVDGTLSTALRARATSSSAPGPAGRSCSRSAIADAEESGLV